MSSQNVENILKYCNGRYTLCDIFLKRIEEIKRFYPAVLNDAALGAS